MDDTTVEAARRLMLADPEGPDRWDALSDDHRDYYLAFAAALPDPRPTEAEVRRSPSQRWDGHCCPADPECEHSFLDMDDLTRWMDTPLTDAEAAEIADPGYAERCPTCGSSEPSFRRNLYWKGESAGVCPDAWHPPGAGSPGHPAVPIQAPTDRTGCCDDQRKPCAYHEGALDAADAAEPLPVPTVTVRREGDAE